MRYRIEKDSIGEFQLPAEVYYGIHTARSKETFQLTKHGLNRQMIKALAQVKKSAAKTNMELGFLNKKIAEAIILSCEEILNGRLHGQFVTDLVQGGSGTSMNMNANEVIANRANEMLGGTKGKYDFVDPLKHVNLHHSSNEAVLLSGKLTTIRLTKKLMVEAKKLVNALDEKTKAFGLLLEEPLSPAFELQAMLSVLERDMKRVDQAMGLFYEIAIGASYFETKQIVDPLYVKKFIKNFTHYTGEDFLQTKNVFDPPRNLDCFTDISTAFRLMASNLSKTANDIKVLSSKGVIMIPEIQESNYIESSMNPVVLEMVNQISFYIMGNDVTIARCVEAGELEKNIYEPMIFACLFETINLLRRTIRIFREHAIEGLDMKKTTIEG